jgi:hypothetical protein
MNISSFGVLAAILVADYFLLLRIRILESQLEHLLMLGLAVCFIPPALRTNRRPDLQGDVRAVQLEIQGQAGTGSLFTPKSGGGGGVESVVEWRLSSFE